MPQYLIKSGDTLSKIAQQNGTTVQALMAANPNITNPNLIYAGASLNLPGSAPTGGNPAGMPPGATTPPAAPPSGPGGTYQTPTPTNPAGGAPLTPLPPQSGGTGNLSNFTTTLRAALSEAAQSQAKSRMTALSGYVTGGAAPSAINAAIGLAQSGLKTSADTMFTDILDSVKKEISFDPNNYRSVQGGIYDIKNNKWVINSTDSSTTGASKALTRTDAQALGLPLSLVGTNWTVLQTQMNNATPPAWFRSLAEQKAQQSILPSHLAELWTQFRNSFNGAVASKSSSGSGGALNFNNF